MTPILSPVFILFLLFPYLTFMIRLDSNIQPWFILFAWAIILSKVYSGAKISLSRNESVLFLGMFVLVIYVNPFAEINFFGYLKKSAGLLLCWAVYYAFRYVNIRQFSRMLTFAVVVYLLFALMHYIVPGLYHAIVEHLVPIRDFDIGERGSPSLATEATDFGFTAVYFFLFALILGEIGAIGRRRLVFICVTSLLCIALSKSGSGFIGLLAVLFGYSFSYFDRKRFLIALILLLAFIAGAFFLIYMGAELEIRGAGLILMLVSSPELLLETSFVHRFVHNVVGVLNVVGTYGIGSGAGTFTTMAPEFFDNLRLGQTLGLNDYYYYAVRETLEQSPVSMFALLFFEYGLVSLLVIVPVYRIALSCGLRAKASIVILITLTWFQSFPFVYPFFWMLIALPTHNRPCR